MPGERVRTRDQDRVKAAAGGRRTESRQAVTASTYVDRRDPRHPCSSCTKHPPQHTWASNPKPEISGGVPTPHPATSSSFFHHRLASSFRGDQAGSKSISSLPRPPPATSSCCN